jgi:HAD superfamily phosphoserine phosphatase-like hydrolase
MDSTFKVDSRALIPRPETEVLVNLVLNHPALSKIENPAIVDVGTGSGCIILSIAAAKKDGKYLAIDTSDKALELARENAALLRGVPLSRVLPHLFPPPYAPGVQGAIAELRRRGYVLGIVSSGVALVAERVREDLGLDFAVANELLVEDGRFTGEARLRVGLWDKLRVVEAEAARWGLSLSEVAFVGDHLNDVPVLKAVGCGLAYAPKDPQVAAAARHVLKHFNQLPALLGKRS